MEAKLVRDGKAVSSKDVEIVIQDDKLVMKLKKPVRANSGQYQIKMSNGQGEGNKDIMINVQGNIAAAFSSIFKR